MTDRELLELAAKAAGMSQSYNEFWGGFYTLVSDKVKGERWDSNSNWNPLTDDGDALRLAVKLWIRIEEAVYEHCELNLCDYPDPLEATRRAIVCEAAKIGKKMT